MTMSKKFLDWTDILLEQAQGWYVSAIRFLPNLFFAMLALAIFILIGRLFRKATFQVITRLSGKPSVSNLFATVVYVFFVCVGLFAAMDILHWNKAVSSLLAGAGIIGLVLGFAFQDLSANFISGIFIAFKRPFEVGHTVETNGYMGNIEEIQLRSTIIRTFQGLHLMIPNKEIFQKPMINYSLSEERRIEMEFTVYMDQDLSHATELVRTAVEKIDYIVKDRAVECYFTGFGENQIRMIISFWIFNHRPPGFMVARSDAIANITSTCRENGLTLVVPISHTDIDLGTLKEAVKSINP